MKVTTASPTTSPSSRKLMQQFLEAANIALQAIWSNKLRSLLTVLGNIVAVTSIIAVVSLVQGLNAAVKDAIQSQVGAGCVRGHRNPVTLTRQEETRAGPQPPRDARRSRGDARTTAATSASVMAEAGSGGAGQVPHRIARQPANSRRDEGIQPALDHEARARPAHHPERVRRRPARGDPRAGTRRIGCSARSTRSTRPSPIAGVHFQVVGVGRKEGRHARPVPGRVRRDSARPRFSGCSARASPCN